MTYLISCRGLHGRVFLSTGVDRDELDQAWANNGWIWTPILSHARLFSDIPSLHNFMREYIDSDRWALCNILTLDQTIILGVMES